MSTKPGALNQDDHMNRADLMNWLRENNISYAATFTNQQLRRLYDENVALELDERVDDNEGGVGDEIQNEQRDQENINKRFQLEDEEAELDRELRILRKRQQLAQLRRELEGDLPYFAAEVHHRPKFSDIEHSVSLFNGSDTYDANKWLDDFERVCDSVNGDDIFRLKCIRRLMKPDSDAEWFLRTDSSNNYQQFRDNFLTNFGHIYSVAEVIEKMRTTIYNPTKTSVMGYVLRMQELASRATIDEAHTIRFIVDGLRDRTASIAVLYSATTLMQLKHLIPRYIQLREINFGPSTSSFRSSVETRSKSNIPKPTAIMTSNQVTNQLRCYNCSGMGHVAARCLEPKRSLGSCFRCGSKQHMIRDCPKPKPLNASQVALIDDFRQRDSVPEPTTDNLGHDISELNIVSVAFFLKHETTFCNMYDSLFDTGSPISLMKQSIIPNDLIGSSTRESGYSGLGQFKLCTYGEIYVQITFRNIVKKIKIYVIPDNFIPYPIILGRDWLKAMGIKLMISDKNISRPQIECNSDRANKIRISNNVLHCVYSCFNDKNL